MHLFCSEDAIIESVRGALVDESPAVRQAAAQAFDALQTQIGARSIDQTIPTLLGALTGEGGASEAALSALKELYVHCSRLRIHLLRRD